jgi:Flp pilus assembly protein TadG
MVETGLVLLSLLTLIFGTLDLSLAVFRQSIVSQAARQGARRASVQGSLAPSTMRGGPWGTTTYGPVTASSASTDPKVQAITPYLAGLDLSNVQIKYEWLDNKNTAESRVKVTVSTSYTMLMKFVFGTKTAGLTGSSTMLIAH